MKRFDLIAWTLMLLLFGTLTACDMKIDAEGVPDRVTVETSSDEASGSGSGEDGDEYGDDEWEDDGDYDDWGEYDDEYGDEYGDDWGDEECSEWDEEDFDDWAEEEFGEDFAECPILNEIDFEDLDLEAVDELLYIACGVLNGDVAIEDLDLDDVDLEDIDLEGFGIDESDLEALGLGEIDFDSIDDVDDINIDEIDLEAIEEVLGCVCEAFGYNEDFEDFDDFDDYDEFDDEDFEGFDDDDFDLLDAWLDAYYACVDAGGDELDCELSADEAVGFDDELPGPDADDEDKN